MKQFKDLGNYQIAVTITGEAGTKDRLVLIDLRDGSNYTISGVDKVEGLMDFLAESNFLPKPIEFDEKTPESLFDYLTEKGSSVSYIPVDTIEGKHAGEPGICDLLVGLGLTESYTEAATAILAGEIFIDGVKVTDPTSYPKLQPVQLVSRRSPRGGGYKAYYYACY